MTKDRTQQQEADNLARLFEGVNQASFARTHKVPGGASMVSQHIKGRRPINMESAIAYMKGFGVTMAEISPRLAKQMSKALEESKPTTAATTATQAADALVDQPTQWPFGRVKFAAYEALGEREKGYVEAKLAIAVEEARTGRLSMLVDVSDEAHQFDADLESFEPSKRTLALRRAMVAMEELRQELAEQSAMKRRAQAPENAADSSSAKQPHGHKTRA